MVVRMKVGYGRAKPEFDDVALIAATTGAAVHEVASRAEEAWRLSQRQRRRRVAERGNECAAGMTSRGCSTTTRP